MMYGKRKAIFEAVYEGTINNVTVRLFIDGIIYIYSKLLYIYYTDTDIINDCKKNNKITCLLECDL